MAPTRSFFFGGDKLVTFMGTKIVSTNLTTMEQTTVFGDEHHCVKCPKEEFCPNDPVPSPTPAPSVHPIDEPTEEPTDQFTLPPEAQYQPDPA